MRHHYVPEFLLNAWATNSLDGKVEVFRLDLRKLTSDRHTPKHTGFEFDLYALTKATVAGMSKHAVEEQFLQRIDNSAARVRQKLVTSGLKSLSPDDRGNWTRFLMSLRLRQPAIVIQLRESAADGLAVSLAERPEEYEAIAGTADPPTFVEWTENTFPGLIENFGMSFFHELVQSPEIANILSRMRWWLWDVSTAPNRLLLADNPCIFTHGIDNDSLVVALPLSPTKLFMATKTDQMAVAMRAQLPRNLVVNVNEASLNQATSRIYAENDLPRRFIENRRRV